MNFDRNLQTTNSAQNTVSQWPTDLMANTRANDVLFTSSSTQSALNQGDMSTGSRITNVMSKASVPAYAGRIKYLPYIL